MAGVISTADSFYSLAGMPSGPVALCGFRLVSNLMMPGTWTWMSCICIPG